MIRKLLLTAAALAVGLSATAQAAPTIQSYPRPGVVDITEGSDGNTWITEGVDKVSRVVSADPPVVTQFPSVAAGPTRISTGPDGNLWYSGAAAIGRMTTAGAAVQFTYAVDIGPISGIPITSVKGIAAGPDGKVWIVDNDRVVRLNTNGTAFGAAIVLNIGARQIAPGPDGNMYVAGTDATAKITPAGVKTVFPNVGGGQQQDIVAGPDGNVWAASTGNVSRLSATGFTNFAQPGTDSFGIAAGPDGAVWTSQFATRTVSRVAPDGAITTVGPTSLSPRYIARNSNTNEMWFAADTANPDTGIGVVRGIDIPTAGGGGAPATPDTTKPVITGLTVKYGKQSRTASFSLSEAAKVTLAYSKKSTGRKVRGKCKASAKKGKKCSLLKPAGTQSVQGKQGANTVTLKSLKPGSYSLSVTAIDAAGNQSLAATKTFKVAKAKKKK